jgi:hypothetical protein
VTLVLQSSVGAKSTTGSTSARGDKPLRWAMPVSVLTLSDKPAGKTQTFVDAKEAPHTSATRAYVPAPGDQLTAVNSNGPGGVGALCNRAMLAPDLNTESKRRGTPPGPKRQS